MNFELKSVAWGQASRLAVDALVVVVTDDWQVAGPAAEPLDTLLQQAVANGDLEKGAGKYLSCYRPDGFKAARVVLARAGQGRAADVRKAVGGAMASLRLPSVRRVGVALGALPDPAAAVVAAMGALADGCYVYTTTKPTAKASAVRDVVLAVPSIDAGLRARFELGRATAEGVTVAREWANRPANHATPSMLADAARSLARKGGFQCQVLGQREVESLGMGAFLAVAQGSAQPPRFIVLRHQGGRKGDAPIVLVGKGITFDTGGISLKPAAEMDEMKFDMSGAASVLGTFAALSALKLPLNVVGLIPACENMPDGRAIKPGDVITSMSGQTIEVLNTDAEGRLILCDALTYAQRFKPRAVIDIATLTGACVIALGAVRSGLFASDDGLAAALQQAGEDALDPCWRMPLDDEYAEGLKSNFADVGNVAGRQAGSVTAAKFLQKFVGDVAWAHLDIAGTAWRSGANKGATGRPVPLLVHYLARQAEDGVQAAPEAPVRRARRRT
jgi:leucyl aminopeptidase